MQANILCRLFEKRRRVSS